MATAETWKKYHRYQRKPGFCGPAAIQIVLAKAGIRKSQHEIARYVYKEWWGTAQQMILAYLSKFFKIVNYKHDATFADITFHLNKGNIIVVNWWDDFDENEQGGHYSVVGDYDSKLGALTLVDPSNERPGIWTISENEFRDKWYDTLDVHDRTWIAGWMLWVDPKSII